jgi:hypothetical protein
MKPHHKTRLLLALMAGYAMLIPFAWYLLKVFELGGSATIVTHIGPNGPDRFLSVHSPLFKATYYSYGTILSAIGMLLHVAMLALQVRAALFPGRYCLVQYPIVDKALAVAAGPLLVAVLAHVVVSALLLQAYYFLPYLFLIYISVLVATCLLLRSYIRQHL